MAEAESLTRWGGVRYALVSRLQEQRPSPLLFFSSKTALLEGLEVDQYMWGILNAIQQ